MKTNTQELNAKQQGVKKTGSLASEKRIDLIFCLLIVALPTIQFIIFYIGVNFNSILLTFQDYNAETAKYTFVGFDNVIKVFKDFSFEPAMFKGLRNSLILYVVNLFCGSFLAIIFSYTIFKKVKGYGFFRIMLYFPSLISPMVLVLLFRNFVDKGLPHLIKIMTGNLPLGLLSNPNTQFGTLMFFSIYFAFGTSVLLYSGAMSGINESVVEAAKLDGVNNFQELTKIVLPLIYPTFVTFMTVGVVGIFTNQMGLFGFYGAKALSYDMYTFGYYLFRKTSQISGLADYPPLAALAMVVSMFTIPLTIIIRAVLRKVGPKVD